MRLERSCVGVPLNPLRSMCSELGRRRRGPRDDCAHHSMISRGGTASTIFMVSRLKRHMSSVPLSRELVGRDSVCEACLLPRGATLRRAVDLHRVGAGMTILVELDGGRFPIERSAFSALLDNSVASTYVDYQRAIECGSIPFAKLEYLAHRGEIPVALFFAPLPLVQAQVDAKTEKLLSGVSKTTFSVNSRERVELRDIELIVKDLIRKQELLKRYDSSLKKNEIIGLLRKSGPSAGADAARLSSALQLSHADVSAARNKGAALEHLISRVEANQILVSRSVQNYMPQRLHHVEFSGMTIKDTKVPYIFLAGGDHGDAQEPTGRTIFTLMLMTVLVARGIFAPVTWDGQSTGSQVGREYDIAGAMLMPTELLNARRPSTLEEMREVADYCKVTPSAVVMRALRLKLIGQRDAGALLAQLRRDYESQPKTTARNPRPENAVRKYNGAEFTRRMLAALDANALSPREFCRSVCLNKLSPDQISDLRKALR